MELIERYFPVLFPIAFIAMWLASTIVMGFLSGWFALMKRYPDRAEAAVLTLSMQSGRVGLLGMSGILNLTACRGGLRIGIFWLFGPFCRDIFVPWGDIRVDRGAGLMGLSVCLRFGPSIFEQLMIKESAAERLLAAVASKP